jgi:hypothetical protein
MTCFQLRWPWWPVWTFNPRTYVHRLARSVVFPVISSVLPSTTVCRILYEFAAAGRWEMDRSYIVPNTATRRSSDNRIWVLCVGPFWPIVCFPTVGESVVVSLGLACSVIYLPQLVFSLTGCGSGLYRWKLASHLNMNLDLGFAYKKKEIQFFCT